MSGNVEHSPLLQLSGRRKRFALGEALACMDSRFTAFGTDDHRFQGAKTQWESSFLSRREPSVLW